VRLDAYGEKLGSVEVCPPDLIVTAGSRFHMRVTYIVGETPVTTGGAVRFRLPGTPPSSGQTGRSPATVPHLWHAEVLAR